MPVAAAVPLIAAGVSAISSGAGVYAAGKMNKKTREWNEKMYGIQREDALRDWEVQNAYNSPEQQMARLKAAGLNPNLVYGTGAATSSASPVHSTDVKSWSPNAPDFAGVGQAAVEGVKAYQDFTLQQETVKNMVAQRRNMELDSALKTVQISSDGIKNASSALELEKSKALYDTSIATAEERLRNLSATTDIKISKEVRDAALHAPTLAAAFERVAAISAQTGVAKAQIDNLKKTGVLQQLEINMRKLGMTFNDSIVLRMLAQYANGMSLPDAVKALAGEIGKGVSEALPNLPEQKIYRADLDAKKTAEAWKKFRERSR